MSSYYIASLKHTHKHHEHIVWWQKNECGYTPVLGDYVGEYDEATAATLNDGHSTIAVPVEAARAVSSPEPHFENSSGTHRFYDQRGPVVDNTRKNWNALLAARLQPKGGQIKPRPEVFRGTRRCIPTTGSQS